MSSVPSNIIVNGKYDAVFNQCYHVYSIGFLNTVTQTSCADQSGQLCYSLNEVDVTYDFCNCLLENTDNQATVGTSEAVWCGCVNNHPVLAGVDYSSESTCTVGGGLSSDSSGSTGSATSSGSTGSTSSSGSIGSATSSRSIGSATSIRSIGSTSSSGNTASSNTTTLFSSSGASTEISVTSSVSGESASSSTIKLSATHGSNTNSGIASASRSSSTSDNTSKISNPKSSLTSSKTSSPSANAGVQSGKTLNKNRDGLLLGACLIFSIFFMSMTMQI